MNVNYRQAIDGMAAELDTLDRRRALIVQALAGLRELAGDAHVIDAPARANVRIAKEPRALNRTDRPTDRPTDRARPAPRRSAVRSLPSSHETELTAVLDALRKRTPQAPGELQLALKVTPLMLRKRLDVLEASGAISRTGTGPRNRRIHLGVAGKSAAKEAL